MNPSAEVSPIPIASVLSLDLDASLITKEALDLGSISKYAKLAYLLHNVFTREECEALITISEHTGYTDALVHIGGGRQVLMKGYRDGCRVLIDSREFVRRLLQQRISQYLPSSFMGKKLVEINERLRFLRYDPGDKFQSHCDSSYYRPDNSARSLITLQIYLNDNFDGGETTFLERRTNKCIPVVPRTGMILVFEHDILHEGSLVKKVYNQNRCTLHDGS